MKLGFFTSYNCGIVLWAKIGTLNRELALYRKLGELGIEVHIFTLERKRDIGDVVSDSVFRGLILHCLYPNWLPFNRFLALVLMPIFLILNKKFGKTMDVLKTNQGHAGIHVYLAAKMWGRPYVSRSGYILNEQLHNRKSRPLKDVVQAWFERIVMHHASICFVPSEYHLSWCRVNLKLSRLECIPNNVDTDIFKPDERTRSDCVVSVGRVVAMKRQNMILEACKKANVPMVLVGDGPCLEDIKRNADKISAKLFALGRVDNMQLPKVYADSLIYVIASEYEGHPKTLIEAMSCGCVCVGTKNPGIQNQIVDGENGLLVEDNVDAIANAIRSIVADENLSSRLREGARRYALEHFALLSLAQKEVQILESIANQR